ncbi:hypothetical protein M422DRAFT_23557 [Sphaerobolus stellatus SS14]|nr:hypothetical protein M422DRAFT_23557 [Sphaerobolus stellatus SS14]
MDATKGGSRLAGRRRDRSKTVQFMQEKYYPTSAQTSPIEGNSPHWGKPHIGQAGGANRKKKNKFVKFLYNAFVRPFKK